MFKLLRGVRKIYLIKLKADWATSAFLHFVKEPVWPVDADILQEGETISSVKMQFKSIGSAQKFFYTVGIVSGILAIMD